MPIIDGVDRILVARAVYDFAVDGGAQAAHVLVTDPPIPDNSIILGGFVDVITTCTSAGADAGTGALHVEGAGDIVAAVAISDGANPWDAGRRPIVPKFNTPESTSVRTTADRAITFTTAVQNFTAGKFHVFLFYVLSE